MFAMDMVCNNLQSVVLTFCNCHQFSWQLATVCNCLDSLQLSYQCETILPVFDSFDSLQRVCNFYFNGQNITMMSIENHSNTSLLN